MCYILKFDLIVVWIIFLMEITNIKRFTNCISEFDDNIMFRKKEMLGQILGPIIFLIDACELILSFIYFY